MLLVDCAGGGGVREAVAALVRQLPALGWGVVPVFARYNDADGTAEPDGVYVFRGAHLMDGARYRDLADNQTKLGATPK